MLRDDHEFIPAIQHYSQAIKINPHFAEAHNNIANIFKEIGKLTTAVKHYERALSVEPNNSRTLNNLGNTLRQLNEIEKSVTVYRKALEISPGYGYAYNNLGLALKVQGDVEAAISNYTKAIKIKPNFRKAYYNLGNEYLHTGNTNDAHKSFKTAIEQRPNFPAAQHLLASITSGKTQSAPREYVERLFDGYAERFDASLVEKLRYQIPNRLVNFIFQSHSGDKLGSVIDLGCGTGLIGQSLRPFCDNIEGIDLSRQMVNQAQKKALYDKLTDIDIITYPTSANLDFDYFIATDVFIYVGDLENIFQLIKSRSVRNGTLVFSTEHATEDGYHLMSSGRYFHSKNYIEDLCEKFRFMLTSFQEGPLRFESKAMLSGGLYSLKF